MQSPSDCVLVYMYTPMGFIIDCTIYLWVSLRTGPRNARRGQGGWGVGGVQYLQKKKSEKEGRGLFFFHIWAK